MKPKEFNVGLFGFGTVGCGVVSTLKSNSGVITEKTGVRITMKRIVDIDTKRDRGVPLGRATFGGDRAAILDDESIPIVIELIGGAGVAREIVTEALKKKKHVVTANKELIARHGMELEALSRKNGVRILFEAAVGGGIPILTPLLTCLRANKINRVIGIVNGTTNFILSQMEAAGAGFAEALKEAQARGYAEADPTNDVEGFDAAYKAVVLASSAFGKYVNVGKVFREGITKISCDEMKYANELGYTIKLLATLENLKSGIDVRVHPALLPKSHPLASVNGVLNAIYIEGQPIGPLMFVGEGAGPSATSSAIVGDVISLATGCHDAEWRPDIFVKSELAPIDQVSNAFYIRMRVDDKAGVLAETARCFGETRVSIASMMQRRAAGGHAEIVWLTHSTTEGNLKNAIKKIKKLKCVDEVISVIRVYE